MEGYDDYGNSDDGKRKIAALRGDTRQRIDQVLTGEMSGLGFGRSALISAFLDMYSMMTFEQKALVHALAAVAEKNLPS